MGPPDIVDEFENSVQRLQRLHTEYMGKAMSDEVYDRFATLRDDTIPALRKQLREALALFVSRKYPANPHSSII